MAIREIRVEGDDILRKKSREVEVVDDRIREILNDMAETMYKYDGVGLAAVQVGILKRLIVIDVVGDGKHLLKLVNPKITKAKGSARCQEGCLSVPNKYAYVDRPTKVTVEALDENGKKIKIVGEELLAQALCHEIDHLEGILYTDIMEPGTLEVIPQEGVENIDPNNKII